jgi:hypothetical protein
VDELVLQGFDGEVAWFQGPWSSARIGDRDGAWSDPCAEECGLGRGVHALGDLTGDGADDLGIPAPDLGGRLSVAETLETVAVTELAIQFVGLADGNSLGSAGAGADLDGDGQLDLTVGASRVYASSPALGGLLVYLGPIEPGAYTDADADLAIYGEQPGDSFGAAIEALDADGDAQDDLAIGAPGYDAGSGAVYLVSGAGLFP